MDFTDAQLEQLKPLRDRIDWFVAVHLSLRRAARALRVDVGYLSRLRNGKMANPSDSLLRKLGLERVVSYRVLPQAKIKRTSGG